MLKSTPFYSVSWKVCVYRREVVRRSGLGSVPIPGAFLNPGNFRVDCAAYMRMQHVKYGVSFVKRPLGCCKMKQGLKLLASSLRSKSNLNIIQIFHRLGSHSPATYSAGLTHQFTRMLSQIGFYIYVPLLVGLLDSSLVRSQCYWPNSSLAHNYLPCRDQPNTSCCLAGEACLDSGLCYGALGLVYRGACTGMFLTFGGWICIDSSRDSNYGGAACPQQCTDSTTRTSSYLTGKERATDIYLSC